MSTCNWARCFLILAKSFEADVAARARSQSKHNQSTKRSLDNVSTENSRSEAVTMITSLFIDPDGARAGERRFRYPGPAQPHFRRYLRTWDRLPLPHPRRQGLETPPWYVFYFFALLIITYRFFSSNHKHDDNGEGITAWGRVKGVKGQRGSRRVLTRLEPCYLLFCFLFFVFTNY